MNDPVPSPGSRMPGAPRTRGRRVLIVDDYADSRELYREYLDLLGFEVDVASDGEAALARAREGHPDVILMDLSLPLLDGWEAIKRLKGDPRTSDIPIIAFTGHVLPDHVARARAAGCDDFCPKPCLPEDVEAKIRQLIPGLRVADA